MHNVLFFATEDIFYAGVTVNLKGIGVTTTAASPDNFSMSSANTIDTVIVDIDKHGFDVINDVRKVWPAKGIIGFSTYFNREILDRLFDLKVDGYFNRNSDKEDILHCVKEVNSLRSCFLRK